MRSRRSLTTNLLGDNGLALPVDAAKIKLGFRRHCSQIKLPLRRILADQLTREFRDLCCRKSCALANRTREAVAKRVAARHGFTLCGPGPPAHGAVSPVGRDLPVGAHAALDIGVVTNSGCCGRSLPFG